MKILILDDEIVSRTKLTIIMERFGECDAVDNGKDAIALFRAAHHKAKPYDLIMLDINMPDMNGLELIMEMKQDEILKAIPVVMVTTEGSKDRVDEFIEKGASGYIKKPFSPEEIRDKLNQIMGETDDEKGSFDNGDEDLDF